MINLGKLAVVMAAITLGAVGGGWAQQADVSYRGVVIAKNSTENTFLNGTNYGKVNTTNGQVLRQFEIRNRGGAPITVGVVSITGTHKDDFPSAQPEDTQLAIEETTLLNVAFNPSADGVRTAKVVIPMTGGNYEFNIQGEGFTGATLAPANLKVALGPRSTTLRRPIKGVETYLVKSTVEIQNLASIPSSPAVVEVYETFNGYLYPHYTPVFTKEIPSMPAYNPTRPLIRRIPLVLKPSFDDGTYFVQVKPVSNTDGDWFDNQVRRFFSIF